MGGGTSRPADERSRSTYQREPPIWGSESQYGSYPPPPTAEPYVGVSRPYYAAPQSPPYQTPQQQFGDVASRAPPPERKATLDPRFLRITDNYSTLEQYNLLRTDNKDISSCS